MTADDRLARELARSTEMRALVFLLQDALRCAECAMPATCRVHRSSVTSDWGPASCDEHRDAMKMQESMTLPEGVTVLTWECGDAKLARRFRFLLTGEPPPSETKL
jgi:hypothetical protein